MEREFEDHWQRDRRAELLELAGRAFPKLVEEAWRGLRQGDQKEGETWMDLCRRVMFEEAERCFSEVDRRAGEAP
jgi:hypothetical protein